MDRISSHTLDEATPRLSTPWALFTVEAFASVGGNLLQVGIFFYTNRRFGWGLKENFTLAAVQGIVYVAGALLAHGLAVRVPPRKALVGLYSVLAGIAFATTFAAGPVGVVSAVLAYTAVVALSWPMLESLVSVGLDAEQLSKRISAYNFVWAGAGAITLAVNGAIIEYWSVGVFIIPAIGHAFSALLLIATSSKRRTDASTAATEAPTAHAQPEEALLRSRTLALWLSRISMPASYALIYALSALLPSLPPMQQIPTWAATLVGSTWLIARWGAFVALGLHDWWHTRPKWLVGAAWLMLLGFVGAGWQPASDLSINLAWLIVCQVVIGLAIGLIYSASLYFGMVLSEGSTEHSGYHEALIGLGSILGPGAGAAAMWFYPGNLNLGLTAVSGVLLASTFLAMVASNIASRRAQPAPTASN
jgi:hypothetical protein